MELLPAIERKADSGAAGGLLEDWVSGDRGKEASAGAAPAVTGGGLGEMTGDSGKKAD